MSKLYKSTHRGYNKVLKRQEYLFPFTVDDATFTELQATIPGTTEVEPGFIPDPPPPVPVPDPPPPPPIVYSYSLTLGSGGTNYVAEDELTLVAGGVTFTITVATVNGSTGAITAFNNTPTEGTTYLEVSATGASGGTGSGATFSVASSTH